MKRLCTVLAAGALVLPSLAAAGVYTQSPDPANVNPGGSATIQILFAGDGDTQDTQLDLEYNAAVFTTVTPTVLVAGSVCSVLTAPARIRIVPPSGAGVPLTSTPTAYCGFAFGAAAAAPLGNYDFTQSFIECTGTATPPCTRSGTFRLTVAVGPSAPTVSPLAAVTLPAGPINLTATGSVPVSVASAGVPTASLALACTIPATGASAFAVTTGGSQTFNAPATVGPATPIGVTCVRGAADVTATLTCTQTATPGPNPANLTAAITCPAGTTAPNPGSVPAAPGPVALVGAPGGPATGSVSFTNVGGTLAYTVTGCTPSAGYTTATTFPVNVAIGGTGSVGVSCTAPTAAGTSSAPGTLACTTSAAGFNPTFNLTCSSQVASIPTLGMGGKALMVLMMLGFGLIGFQLYRRSA